jgi:hypothetical protein
MTPATHVSTNSERTDSTLRPVLAVVQAGIIRAVFPASEGGEATPAAQSWATLMQRPATIYQVDVRLAVPMPGGRPDLQDAEAWMDVLTVRPLQRARLPWNPRPGTHADRRRRARERPCIRMK